MVDVTSEIGRRPRSGSDLPHRWPAVPDQIHERPPLELKALLTRKSFSDPFDQVVVVLHEEENPHDRGTGYVDGDPRTVSDVSAFGTN